MRNLLPLLLLWPALAFAASSSNGYVWNASTGQWVPMAGDSSGNASVTCSGCTFTGTTAPLAVTPTDRGGTITAGGTPQNAMASNSARNGGHCENPTSATEPLYVAVVGAATVGGAGNFCDLAPGGSCTLAPTGQTIIRTAVSVNATTTGHRFLCTEEQ